MRVQPLHAEPRTARPRACAATQPRAEITLGPHQDLAAVEHDWRRFEQSADCTPFQTFDWLSPGSATSAR